MSLAEFYREMISICFLDERDEKQYWLIRRYKEKLPLHVTDKLGLLLKKSQKMMHQELSQPNPFMELIRPDEQHAPYYVFGVDFSVNKK